MGIGRKLTLVAFFAGAYAALALSRACPRAERRVEGLALSRAEGARPEAT